MSNPDAAAAIRWDERGRRYTDAARVVLAVANAVMDTADPDPDHADLRRSTYVLTCRIADDMERYADLCREKAFSARNPGGRSYDLKVCDHGCCPVEVCDFAEDCDTHRVAS